LEDFIVDDDVLDGEAVYKPKRRSKPKKQVRPSIIGSSPSSDGGDYRAEETDGIPTTFSESDEDLRELDLFKKKPTKSFKGKNSVVGPVILDSDDESVPPGSSSKAESSKPTNYDHSTKQPPMISSFVASTKMKHMMEQLVSWAESHPDDKVCMSPQSTAYIDPIRQWLFLNGPVHWTYVQTI
jgi:hypothetical protein